MLLNPYPSTLWVQLSYSWHTSSAQEWQLHHSSLHRVGLVLDTIETSSSHHFGRQGWECSTCTAVFSSHRYSEMLLWGRFGEKLWRGCRMGIKSQRLQAERMDVVVRFTMELVLETAANHRNLILQSILQGVLCATCKPVVLEFTPCSDSYFQRCWSLAGILRHPSSSSAVMFLSGQGLGENMHSVTV